VLISLCSPSLSIPLPAELLVLYCFLFSDNQEPGTVGKSRPLRGSRFLLLYSPDPRTIVAMRRSWTARLAATIAVSHSFSQFAIAQDLVSSVSQSPSPTPTASESVNSSSATPTSSGEPTVHTIKAGSGGFKFDPPELHNVSVGDIVTWEFYPPDHSVARAEWQSACVPYEYTGKDKVGFWSETQWVNNTNEVCLLVEDTTNILTGL
jgi:plastocyanin